MALMPPGMSRLRQCVGITLVRGEYSSRAPPGRNGARKAESACGRMRMSSESFELAVSRRGFVAGSVAALAVPGQAAEEARAAQEGKGLRVVCVGAHPDDPESGCGGTLARYAAAGHRVTVLYLTRGEGGIKGKSADDAAAIRSAEAEEACKLLGARPVFVGQIDGATEVNRERAQALRKLLLAEEP